MEQQTCPPKKVLLIRFSSLGDVVLTSALLEPLNKAGYKVDLITYPQWAEVFKEDPRLEVYPVSKERLKKDFFNLIREINQKNYLAVLDLHSNLKSFLLKTFIKAPKKATYKKRSLFRRLCVFLNNIGITYLKNKPFDVLSAYGKTLEVLGLKVSSLRPYIKVNPANFQESLKKFNLKEGSYIAVGVGARYRKKRYPYFKELTQLLAKEKTVVLVGDKSDWEQTKDWKHIINLCGKLPLNQTLHVLKGASSFVGNDSGLTHMARAVKTPVFTIYGGTHPCLGFAPYPDEGKVISKNLPCSPCDIHGKGNCKFKDYRCLDIPPQRVLKEINQWLLT